MYFFLVLINNQNFKKSMAEAKSKRDQIWEEKRRQREERLLRMEGQVQENQFHHFQEPERLPVSLPTPEYVEAALYEPQYPPQPAYQAQQPPPLPYQPGTFQKPPSPGRYQQPPANLPKQPSPPRYEKELNANKNPYKDQQVEYREYLKKQMEEKEQEKRKRHPSNHQQSNPMQQMNQQPITYPFGQQQPYQQQQQLSQQQQSQTPQKLAKQEYAQYLRQQMQEKEQQKKARLSSGGQRVVQQQQLQLQQPLMNQNQSGPQMNAKQEYGEFLRMQMLMKEQQKNDKKQDLQRKFEQADAYPFGKAGGGAPPKPQQAQIAIPTQSDSQYNYGSPYAYQADYVPPQQQIQGGQLQYYQAQQPQGYQLQPMAQPYYQQPPQQQFLLQQQASIPSLIPGPQDMFLQPSINESQNQANYFQGIQEPPKGARNRLGLENANMEDLQKKEKQKKEMQRVLQEQIEEKKRKKEEEKKMLEDEERMREAKLRKEIEQAELERKREEDAKKQKQGKLEQENIDLQEQQRLQKLQERKNRKQQRQNQQPDQPEEANDQQQMFYNQPPPSAPKSENYLKDFLINEKIKEGVSQEQSIIDFYKNGPSQRLEVQQNRDIEELKKQMMLQQDNLQRQIHQVMSQAQQAIEGRNKAEQDLLALKQQVQNKYIQEEQHHNDLMIALVKNDPKWEKQVFPPHLLAQAEIAEYRNLAMPELKENMQLPERALQGGFQPVYQSKPMVLKEESREAKQQFREQFGLQSLVSDSNMVPIDNNASLIPRPPPERPLPQIDELQNYFEESLRAGEQMEGMSQKPPRPRSNYHPAWNVPSIDSEFTKEIDNLLNYKPLQPTINRPPSTSKPLGGSTNRPPSTFNRAANSIIGDNQKGMTLNSDFPDLTMARKTDTLDVAGVHKKLDQKLMVLNELEQDDDLRKLDQLLLQYNK